MYANTSTVDPLMWYSYSGCQEEADFVKNKATNISSSPDWDMYLSSSIQQDSSPVNIYFQCGDYSREWGVLCQNVAVTGVCFSDNCNSFSGYPSLKAWDNLPPDPEQTDAFHFTIGGAVVGGVVGVCLLLFASALAAQRRTKHIQKSYKAASAAAITETPTGRLFDNLLEVDDMESTLFESI
jgi:hypothetical protein